MPRSASSNYTTGDEAFDVVTASGGVYGAKTNYDVPRLTQALEAHTHASGRGAAVTRLGAGATGADLTLSAALSAVGVTTTGAAGITVSSATALTVAKTGSNYALQVDTATASAATGLKITSAAAAGGLAVAVISSGTNEALTIGSKGAAALNLQTNGANGVVISAAGEVTKPLQPAFLAYNSADDTNQTGNGATVTVDFDTEVFDQGGDFAADTFTAPVTGKYQLNVQVQVSNLSAAMTGLNLSLITSNRTYYYLTVVATSGSFTYILPVLADMDAADTAYVSVTITGGVGDTATIEGSASCPTTFSGHLAC